MSNDPKTPLDPRRNVQRRAPILESTDDGVLSVPARRSRGRPKRTEETEAQRAAAIERVKQLDATSVSTQTGRGRKPGIPNRPPPVDGSPRKHTSRPSAKTLYRRALREGDNIDANEINLRDKPPEVDEDTYTDIKAPYIDRDENAQRKAPAFNQGIRPLDPIEELSKATPDQLSFLMHSNFALWAQCSGIEVDSRKFDFDNHRYLLPIYLDESREIAWIKSAQMGATIYEVLRLLWFCRYKTLKCGLYFPTQDGVVNLSKDRLAPIIRSIPELTQAVADAEGSEALNLKQIANIHGKISSLYMMYLGGRASKDSVPLDVIAFDELRLVDPSDVDQALERVSHSTYKYKMYVSTAGMPSSDIHRRFLLGNQMTWHTRCRCPDGFVASDAFPDCIAVTEKEVYLRCPKCKTRINDPQNGRYIAHNPGADYSSYHVSQFVSKFISPKEIWENYQRTTNKKEFYNAKLGRPYVDAENMPVNDDVLENCVNPDLRWLVNQDRRERKNCAMGVDQHGGNVYVVIMRRNPDGKKILVHIEVVDQLNPDYWEAGKPVSPFKRVHQLMRDFDVGLCVVDAMPNYNEATELARTFPGRVFVSWYGSEKQKDMVMWSDRLKHKEAIKRGSREIKIKWQCVLNRYSAIDYALQHFTNRHIEMPHPDALVQVVRQPDGRYGAENICRTQYWLHLRSIVRQKEIINEQTGVYKMAWVYLGRDPHFVHATTYCCIAMERLKRQAVFVM